MSPRVPTPSPRLLAAGVLLAVAAGVVLRFTTSSDLWLDEALTVHTARLPLDEMLEQLRHDGHPPLYYLLLHWWMEVFGDGDAAVRALSGLFGVGALPLVWLAAKRYGGRAVGAAAVVLLATSPFAVRYATETRMYSLVMVLVLAGWLLLRSALERPSLGRLAGLAVVSGLLALTHYWAFYLLAAVGLLLLVGWRRGRTEARNALLAVVAGAVLFLPWLPSFLEQARNTGTPWGLPARPTTILAISFTDWGGGPNGEAQVLGVALLGLLVLALFGRAVDERRIELDLATSPAARPEVVAGAITFAFAVVAAYATSGAFASRYTAVIFPIVLLVAALGTLTLADVRVRAGLLVVLALLGLIGSVRNATTQRTQGAEIAAYINANGAPGDVVVFCPDQLGPAVARRLGDAFVGMTYPEGASPELVDWVDYEERQQAGDPEAFAAEAQARAGEGTVWLVWRAGYRTLGRRCERIEAQLKTDRPGGKAVVSTEGVFEPAWLYQYGPVPG